MKTLIGILNADLGNLRSVSNAVHSLGNEFRMVSRSGDMPDLTHLIIPGVGSYFKAMSHLERLGMVEPIRDFAQTGKPILGICLGMQILSDVGEEIQGTSGLALIPGAVTLMTDKPGYAVPHVGWNSVSLRQPHPVLEGVKDGTDFYFVHSFYFRPIDTATVLGTTEYGEEFSSAVARRNVVGFQFHPEKSQTNGLRLLENFCAWDGEC